jgi:hypothetical protein
MAWKGKGKGKCKGKGKGKGEVPCKVDSKLKNVETFDLTGVRPCAREGCVFAANWHPTHCCGACERGIGHGRCCRKQTFQPVPSPEVSAMATHKQDADFTFPVVVGDGQNLTISWNRGDEAWQVAHEFAEEHGILEDEIPTIQAFVQDAMALGTCTNESVDTVNEHQQDGDEIPKQKDMESVEQQDPKLEVVMAACNDVTIIETVPPEQDKEETRIAKEVDNYEFVEASTKPEAAAEEKSSEADDDLLKTAMHLAEASLGDVDVLVGLLQMHNGSVRRVLEELVSEP